VGVSHAHSVQRECDSGAATPCFAAPVTLPDPWLRVVVIPSSYNGLMFDVSGSRPTDRKSVDAVVAVDAARVCDAALAELVVELDAARRRVEAALLAARGELAAREVHKADGAGSVATWLAHRCELSGHAARGLAQTAVGLRSMPVAAAEVSAGSLSSAKAALLAKTRTLVDTEVFGEAEGFLVEQIRGLTIDHAARVLRFWVNQVDAQSEQPLAERLRERRRLYVSRTFQGALDVSGLLDPESGAIVESALNELMDELRLKDGDGLAVWQRRADALVEMARRALTRSSDDGRPPVPAFTLVMDVTDAVRPPAAIAPDSTARDGATSPGAPPLPMTDAEGEAFWAVARDAERTARVAATDPLVRLRAELLPGVPVSGEALARMLCDCSISRVAMVGDDEIVNLGRTTYTPSRAQRRALAVRDGGCGFPGCDRQPSRCHAHHIQHWTKQGPTDLPNLVLLCSYHHHLVHEGGFGVARVDGELRWTGPDSTEIIDARPRQPRLWRSRPPPGAEAA
jgi:hypothetical protein